jgi:hypothetical protein
MSKFTNPLKNINVASPCSQDWNAMIGTERKRYCGECKLNVYNLSGMSRAEAENLIVNSEGRLCVRFYRRDDGSILTKDCPVGWAAIKRRISRTAAAALSVLIGLLTGLGFAAFFSQTKPRVLMGDLVGKFDREVMGNMAIPTPTPTPKNSNEPTMGVMVPPKQTPVKITRN